MSEVEAGALRGKVALVTGASSGLRRATANAAAYCASKFGLTGLTESLADEGRAHGIRACVIYPGAVATNWGAWTPEERGGAQEAPGSQALPPAQVADFIVWLAAAPSNFVLTEGIIVPVEEGLP